ncbi:MAG: MFS transporter [Bacteroidia bacterium]|nr:MFS transporter [Bacteroidia bacterium]
MATWLDKWNPEDEHFWESEGKKIAWRTLWITTATLILSFATWFMMSAIVVKLPGIGFKFNSDQLFWLAAMPGLAAGTLRIIHTFLLPIYGTRHIITIATLIKLIPVIGIGLAVMDPNTPFWVFMVLAFTSGFGGGDFSSYMPSTNMFFPKRLKGTALGIQAGIGNFGVSVAQFMTPVMIGVATYGAVEVFTAVDPKEATATLKSIDAEKRTEIFASLDTAVQSKIITAVPKKAKDSVKTIVPLTDKVAFFSALPVKAQAKAISSINPKAGEVILKKIDEATKAVKNKDIHLQSAAFWYAPLLLILGILCWFMLRSIPVKASFKEQLDIFSNKHTWYCTLTYVMTFGGFSGLAAAFPLMIKTLYGGFENAPDPLAFAFYGPLIGSASRVIFGFIADKVGGAVLTTVTGLGLIVGASMLVTMGLVAPTSMEQFPIFVAVMLGLFFFTGIGNAGTFRQYPIIFAENQRQAAGVLGWTGAIAAFGPFIFATLIGNNITAKGNPNLFFIGLLIFSLIATVINWYYYQRKGCERPS